jgi:heat shock protein HslJ
VKFAAADLVNAALAYYNNARVPGYFRGGCMFSGTGFVRQAAAALILAAAASNANPARADAAFPFGMIMTLDAARQPGSKRLPNLEIGDDGEAVLELWCKGGTGQFSVAGNTVIFVAGPLEDRACPPAKAQADDDLVAALSEAATWKRQDDLVSFIGTKTLRFRLGTN